MDVPPHGLPLAPRWILTVNVSAPDPQQFPRFLTFRTGETRWDALPVCVTGLFDSTGLPIEAWRAAGRADVVKDGPHRTVYRLNLPEGRFYLKHYRLADWRARLQNAVRPCRALLEWNAARAVAAAGIRTFETVAVGRTLAGNRVADSYLVSRAIDGTETLHDFCEETLRRLPQARQSRVRRALAGQLGELVARLHAAGLVHRDLHAGNILIRAAPADQVELWLIDLHAVVARRRVSFRQARSNIALLAHFFARHATRSDRLRFFRAYWNKLNGAGDSLLQRRTFAGAAQELQHHCARATERAYRAGDRKWQRANRRLIIADDRGVRCRGLSELGRARIEELRDEPERLFGVPGLRRPKAVRALTRTARSSVWIDDTRLGVLAVARETTSWRDRLRLRLGMSPLRLAWEAGHARLRRGLPAPRPLLWVSRRDGAVLREYLLLEEGPGVESLIDLPHEETVRGPIRVRQRRTSQAPPGETALVSPR